MNNKDGKENEWEGETCEAGERCPIEGYWEQIETGKIDLHQTDDFFSPLHPSLIPYKKATYKYIGRKKDNP